MKGMIVKMENEAVLINKFDSIQRCINRINEEYEGNPAWTDRKIKK